MVAERNEAGAVRIDHRDRTVPDEREPAPVRRPARVGDVLLGRRHWRGRPTSQREREQLPRAGGLLRERDEPTARIEPELAGRLGADDVLDRQGIGRSCRCRLGDC
jgi:hypothetical protein